MKTYDTINSSGTLKKIDAPERKTKGEDNCKSITDKSSFIPNSELMKKKLKMLGINTKALYDFTDGKDNGMHIPISRIKGADIAEIEQEIKQDNKNIADAKEKAEAAQKAKEQATAEYNAMKEAMNPNA